MYALKEQNYRIFGWSSFLRIVEIGFQFCNESRFVLNANLNFDAKYRYKLCF